MINKSLITVIIIILPLQVLGQDDSQNLSIQLGATYNHSSFDIYNTTGIGLFLESDYLIQEKYRLGVRFEPIALVYGIWYLPEGCDDGCKEGSSYVVNNYIKADYFIGQPVYETNFIKCQGYVGINILVIAHKRYVITSMELGNWEYAHRTFTNLGIGVRLGFILGRFDLSASYNKTGKDFSDHYGVNLGYILWRK
ncbi:hypothetical protein ACFLS4_01460 [Bacteroidota bacterium]